MDQKIDLQAAERTPGTVLTITRYFDAPPALMFRVWTQPEHVARWWGCAEATGDVRVECDLRVGGAFSAEMLLKDGAVHCIRGVYREIEEPTRLVFTWAWENTAGFQGANTLVTLTFEARNTGTFLTLRHELFADEEACLAHGDGWRASLDRLAGYLPAMLA